MSSIRGNSIRRGWTKTVQPASGKVRIGIMNWRAGSPLPGLQFGEFQKIGPEYFKASLRVRIRTQHLDVTAFHFEVLDGFGDFLFVDVSVAIDEEEIFPRLPLARA